MQLLEEIGDPMAVMTTIQQRHGRRHGDKTWGDASKWSGGARTAVSKLPGTLHSLAPRERLAVEMAVHEESERLAMQGELHALERAWRDAEEIAKIADDMFLPANTDEDLERLRHRDVRGPRDPAE